MRLEDKSDARWQPIMGHPAQRFITDEIECHQRLSLRPSIQRPWRRQMPPPEGPSISYPPKPMNIAAHFFIFLLEMIFGRENPSQNQEGEEDNTHPHTHTHTHKK